jgi:hypothetical protein
MILRQMTYADLACLLNEPRGCHNIAAIAQPRPGCTWGDFFQVWQSAWWFSQKIKHEFNPHIVAGHLIQVIELKSSSQELDRVAC